MKWRIGDVTVTKIVELEVTGGSRFILPQATREAVLPITWLRPHFADEDGRLHMIIHTVVVETRGTTCRVHSWTISPRRALRGSRSTLCCALTCTSIMSAGTRCWSTTNGCRHSRVRAT
jgi:hypothetical protein